METIKLQHLFENHKNLAAIAKLLDTSKNIHIKGLLGSAGAMFAANIFEQTKKNFLYILDDAESAGYFYHDLTQILGPKNILYYPSAYKRAIKFGQTDSGNEILRTEVFSKLQENEGDELIIVTYPEAIAEKVISKEKLKDNTLKISIGEKIDSVFVSEVLDSYGFEYTEYVYEPGQYAIRGSILDVFSYSSECPYRIDFFGDEVETIRLFDIENQLSKEQVKTIQIIPEINKGDLLQETFLNLLPAKTIIGYRDYSWVQGRLTSIYEDVPLLDNPEYIENVQSRLTPENVFTEQIKQFSNIQLGTQAWNNPDTTIKFETILQPIYHKNFDLVNKSFHEFIDEDYTNNIYSVIAKSKTIA